MRWACCETEMVLVGDLAPAWIEGQESGCIDCPNREGCFEVCGRPCLFRDNGYKGVAVGR
jgi:hypothetical protein